MSEVLRSGVLAQGPMVRRLEAGFARGRRRAARGGREQRHDGADSRRCRCWTAAGDEVITSPFTFAATLNAILHAGATVRFADVSPADFCLDPDAVAAAIGDRTRVLMPVHLYGQAADMRRLAPLAEQNGVAIVEDAAQAVGAAFDGRPAGSFGLGCFSLYATKNVTAAEGGMITTADGAPRRPAARAAQPGHAGALPVRAGRPQLPDDRTARRRGHPAAGQVGRDHRGPHPQRRAADEGPGRTARTGPAGGRRRTDARAGTSTRCWSRPARG